MTGSIVNGHFETPYGWRSGHLQTIRSRVVRAEFELGKFGTERSLLVPMNDGSGDQLHVWLHRSRMVPADGARGGLVVLIHGLGGSAESSYIRASTYGLLKAGYNVARVDLRGTGLSAPTCSLLYHAGRTEDLRAIVGKLKHEEEAQDNTTGTPRIAVVGFSLGGAMTLKLMGEPYEDLPLFAGIAVSAPLDLVAGSVYLRRAGFGTYEKSLVFNLKRQALKRGPDQTLRVSDAEHRQLKKARTLAAFDDVITAPRNGWRDSAEYYSVNSPHQFLSEIDIPTLVVYSLDDPMIPSLPYRVVDWKALQDKGFVRRTITTQGGHVGFHERSQALPWFVGQTLDFLKEY